MNAALSAFNTAPAEEARMHLAPVLELSSWVAAVVAARPYQNLEDLLARAESIPWTDDELRTAVTGRPRLGGPVPGSNSYSPVEQANALSDKESRVHIVSLAADYEDRFGITFLIRAAGRSSAEVLHELTRRLGNRPEVELIETARELRDITRLRLTTLFAEPDAP